MGVPLDNKSVPLDKIYHRRLMQQLWRLIWCMY